MYVLRISQKKTIIRTVSSNALERMVNSMIDKINKAGIQGAQNLQEVKGKGEKNVEKLKGKAEEKKVTDALVVEEGKKIAEYIELAKSYPEIRTELVKQIKDAIDSGTFKVNPEQIAKKILEG